MFTRRNLISAAGLIGKACKPGGERLMVLSALASRGDGRVNLQVCSVRFPFRREPPSTRFPVLRLAV